MMVGSARGTILSQNTPSFLETPTLTFSKERQGKDPDSGDSPKVTRGPPSSASVIISARHGRVPQPSPSAQAVHNTHWCPSLHNQPRLCTTQTWKLLHQLFFLTVLKVGSSDLGSGQSVPNEDSLLCLSSVCEFGGVPHFRIFFSFWYVL